MPPQTVDKRTFLSAHPFFKGLEPELIDQVGSHAITRVVKVSTTTVSDGRIRDCSCFLCQGI